MSRPLFHHYFLLATAFILGVSLLHAQDTAPKPVRALLIVGGCCHDYDAQKELISRGLSSRARIEFAVVHEGGKTTDTKIPLYEEDDWYKGFDVVLHDECFAAVKDPQWTERILKPHREGLPAVVIHCAMHCYRDGTGEWFKFCGVTSHRHGKAYPHEVVNLDPANPIMKEFGAAWANPAGELYWIEKVWETAHPLASAKNQEKGNEEVCVWTNQYGKGRVFGTTLGHHNQTVTDPAFLDMLTRGTLWAAGKLSDEYLLPKQAQMIPVDIAKDKPTLASSEEVNKNNFAPHAVDGDLKTRWCAKDGKPGHWWQVDFGKPGKVTGCELEWEAANAEYHYKLESSADGKAWSLLFDAADKARPGTYSHEFDADNVRFLRVTYLGSNTGAWGSIREVRVFGTEKKLASTGTKSGPEEKILKEVKVPPGFEATVFAVPPAVNYPVSVAASVDGDVYVAVDKNGSLDRQPNRGAVLRLRDIDGDGKADQVKRFVSNVDSPRGLVWDRDRLYLMHPPHVSVYVDADHDGVAETSKVLVKNIAFTFKDRPADHTSNGITLGIDGWLYLAIGDFGFMEAEGADGTKLQFRGGGVVRVRTDGSGLEVFSRGTRNILEVAIDPFLNGFTRDNTNDGDGWDIRLHHFPGMEHHGYPSHYKNFTDEAVLPLAEYGGGSGCGAMFISEPGFPEGFGHALYTCDWGRGCIYRHQVTEKGATFTADQSEFVNIPRITDADVDGQGRIYAASWLGATFTYVDENVGYMIRVSPKGHAPTPVPDFAKLDGAALVQALKLSSHRQRLDAQRELLRRQLVPEVAVALQTLAADDEASPASRIAALFAIEQGLGPAATPILAKLANDDSIREYALRALFSRRPEDSKDIPVEPFLVGLKDDSPRVRRQAAEGIARLGRADKANDIVPLLGDSDPIVAHVAINALVRLKAADAAFAAFDKIDNSEFLVRNAARVLQAIHQPAVVSGLVDRFGKEQNSLRREHLLRALCRLHFREGIWKGDSWGTRPDTTGPYYQIETWDESPKIAAVLRAALDKASGAEGSFLAEELNRHRIGLDGTMEKLLAMANSDPSLIPSAVGGVARSKTVLPAALPMLRKAAVDDAMDGPVRYQAIEALLKVNDRTNFAAVLEGLASFDRSKSRSDADRAKEAFKRAGGLDQHCQLFEAEAAKPNNPTGKFAEMALLIVAANNNASPEAREFAKKSIDAGWKEPQRRAQILRAICLGKQFSSKDLVLASLHDPVPEVAKAAKDAARELRLDLTAKPAKAASPRLGSLAVPAAVEAVVNQKGNQVLGEELFTKLNCVKCHTVRKDEPLRGPFLGNIANTYRRKELVESVLLPSKSLAQGFASQAFVLDDGSTINGFVTRESADKLVIRDVDGKEIEIPTSSIEDRTKLAVSIMPEGLAKDVTVEELASLIDYLESLAKK